MTNFSPLGTPQTMTVRGVSGRSFETDVYPAGISGLGICRAMDPGRIVEWCVIHIPSGLMLGMCRDGDSAVNAAHAMAHAVSFVGCFWEHPIETITGNPEAMRRARDAISTYMAS